MHWGIQTNLGKVESQKLIDACRKIGCSYTGLMAIPFAFCPLPELPTDVPTIFWGSIGFIAPIWKSHKWTPGVIFNENFDYTVWSKKWGNRCLNNDGVVTTLEEFSSSNHPANKLFFIRPCADDKAFTGEVIEFGEMKPWMRGIMGAGYGFEKTPVVVSEPVGIHLEWRLYMLGGKAVSASQYRKDFRSCRSADVPREVIDFGERMAAIWSPASLFTLDIAESGGDLYVNEMGTFHSAGMYDADVPKIVHSINEYFEGSHAKLG